MDKLESLQRVVSPVAEEQAGQLHALIVAAAQQGRDHAFFRAASLHPLVAHTLAARGYVVTEVPAAAAAPASFSFFLQPGLRTFRVGL